MLIAMTTPMTPGREYDEKELLAADAAGNAAAGWSTLGFDCDRDERRADSVRDVLSGAWDEHTRTAWGATSQIPGFRRDRDAYARAVREYLASLDAAIPAGQAREAWQRLPWVDDAGGVRVAVLGAFTLSVATSTTHDGQWMGNIRLDGRVLLNLPYTADEDAAKASAWAAICSLHDSLTALRREVEGR